MSKVAELSQELGLSIENHIAIGGLDFFKTLSPPSQTAPLHLKDLIKRLNNALVFLHGAISLEQLCQLKKLSNTIVVFAHNSCQFSVPQYYKHADYVVPVSKYVHNNLTRFDIKNVYPIPVYPYVENHTLPEMPTPSPNLSTIINWNQKKIRDLVLQCLEKVNLYKPISNKCFSSSQGTFRLGIVSRLSRAKRFPELFDALGPALKDLEISIHIYGSGPYREVMAIKKSLGPIKNKVIFYGWAHPTLNPYKNLDALLLGRPDDEALGINALEAQTQNVPPLGINIGSFPEIIQHNNNGFLYEDPEIDQAASFKKLINNLVTSKYQNKIGTLTCNSQFSKENFKKEIYHLIRLANSENHHSKTR
jgi:glycosyltransferase involved in cell wall biosynthesis